MQSPSCNTAFITLGKWASFKISMYPIQKSTSRSGAEFELSIINQPLFAIIILPHPSQIA